MESGRSRSERDANIVTLVSVFSILKNPMILMALVSLVLLVGMPKLMDSSTWPLHYPNN